MHYDVCSSLILLYYIFLFDVNICYRIKMYNFGCCRCNNVLYLRGVDDAAEDGEMKE